MARPNYRRYFRHGMLPQLLAFEACVRLGGVTRAAQELALAQPTVSGLLRKLAETVGEPLLRVRAGRVELTGAGRDVMALCEDLFDALGRFDDARRESGYRPSFASRAPATAPAAIAPTS